MLAQYMQNMQCLKGEGYIREGVSLGYLHCSPAMECIMIQNSTLQVRQ